MKAEYLENELIDSYLNGGLNGNELFAFESRMNSDTSFASKVNNQKTFNQSLEDHELAKFHNRLDQFNPYKNPRISTGFNWGRIAIGSSVLIGLIIGAVSYFSITPEPLEEISVRPVKEKELIVNKEENLTKKVEIVNYESTIIEETKSPSSIDTSEGKELSMYDYMEGSDHNKDDSPNGKEIPNLGTKKLSEPSYVVVGKDIEEEEVLVITSDYNKKMHFIEDDGCSNLSLNTKIESISACESNKGVVKIIDPEVSGGKAPYVYSVNGEDFQELLIFNNLDVGEYQVRVKDSEGCIIKYHNKVQIKKLDCD